VGSPDKNLTSDWLLPIETQQVDVIRVDLKSRRASRTFGLRSMTSRLFTSILAILAAFVSYQLYNPPASLSINMSGNDMKSFEDPNVLKYVEKIQ